MNSRHTRQPGRSAERPFRPGRWVGAACTSAALLYAVLSTGYPLGGGVLYAQPPFANEKGRPFHGGGREGGKRPDWRGGARQGKDLTAEEKRYLASLSPKDRQGIELLRRMVTEGMAHAFIGREATFMPNGAPREQWVKWDPKRGMRRESVNGKGEVFLDDFNKSYVFKPKENKWFFRESILPRPQGRILDVLRKLTKGELKATVDGQDTVAGRVADIVRVGPPDGVPGVVSRFWIDRATGARLKNETVGPDGKLFVQTYYLSLDLAPRFGPDDFKPPANAVPAPDRRKMFHTLEEARKAGVSVPAPGYVPTGFTLRMVEVTDMGKNGRRVALRYGNGITAISLVMIPIKMLPPEAQESGVGTGQGKFLPPPHGGPDRIYVWRDNATGYMLLGAQSEDEMRRIAESVR